MSRPAFRKTKADNSSWGKAPQYVLRVDCGNDAEVISFHDHPGTYIWIGLKKEGRFAGIGVCRDRAALRKFATTLLLVLDKHSKKSKRSGKRGSK